MGNKLASGSVEEAYRGSVTRGQPLFEQGGGLGKDA